MNSVDTSSLSEMVQTCSFTHKDGFTEPPRSSASEPHLVLSSSEENACSSPASSVEVTDDGNKESSKVRNRGSHSSIEGASAGYPHPLSQESSLAEIAAEKARVAAALSSSSSANGSADASTADENDSANEVVAVEDEGCVNMSFTESVDSDAEWQAAPPPIPTAPTAPASPQDAIDAEEDSSPILLRQQQLLSLAPEGPRTEGNMEMYETLGIRVSPSCLSSLSSLLARDSSQFSPFHSRTVSASSAELVYSALQTARPRLAGPQSGVETDLNVSLNPSPTAEHRRGQSLASLASSRYLVSPSSEAFGTPRSVFSPSMSSGVSYRLSPSALGHREVVARGDAEAMDSRFSSPLVTYHTGRGRSPSFPILHSRALSDGAASPDPNGYAHSEESMFYLSTVSSTTLQVCPSLVLGSYSNLASSSVRPTVDSPHIVPSPSYQNEAENGRQRDPSSLLLSMKPWVKNRRKASVPESGPEADRVSHDSSTPSSPLLTGTASLDHLIRYWEKRREEIFRIEGTPSPRPKAQTVTEKKNPSMPSASEPRESTGKKGKPSADKPTKKRGRRRGKKKGGVQKKVVYASPRVFTNEVKEPLAAGSVSPSSASLTHFSGLNDGKNPEEVHSPVIAEGSRSITAVKSGRAASGELASPVDVVKSPPEEEKDNEWHSEEMVFMGESDVGLPLLISSARGVTRMEDAPDNRETAFGSTSFTSHSSELPLRHSHSTRSSQTFVSSSPSYFDSSTSSPPRQRFMQPQSGSSTFVLTRRRSGVLPEADTLNAKFEELNRLQQSSRLSHFGRMRRSDAWEQSTPRDLHQQDDSYLSVQEIVGETSLDRGTKFTTS